MSRGTPRRDRSLHFPSSFSCALAWLGNDKLVFLVQRLLRWTHFRVVRDCQNTLTFGSISARGSCFALFAGHLILGIFYCLCGRGVSICRILPGLLLGLGSRFCFLRFSLTALSNLLLGPLLLMLIDQFVHHLVRRLLLILLCVSFFALLFLLILWCVCLVMPHLFLCVG